MLNVITQKEFSNCLYGISNHAKSLVKLLNDQKILSLSDFLNNRIKLRKNLFTPDVLFVRNDPIQLVNLPDKIASTKILKLEDEIFFGALINNQRIGTILLTNNDFARARGYNADFCDITPTNFIIGWDIDSHHWFDNSFQLALFADIYVPAQYQCSELFARFCPSTIGVVPLGSLQWELEFLIQHSSILFKDRDSSKPTGIHGYYQDYIYRNSIIERWHEVSDQCFLAQNLTPYSSLSPIDRLGFWAQTTTHLVSPVNGDLPFRFFDALITRSAVLVPSELEHAVSRLGLDLADQALIQYFNPSELTVNMMEKLKVNAKVRWEYSRIQAMRTNISLESRIGTHHVSSRIAEILDKSHIFIKRIES